MPTFTPTAPPSTSSFTAATVGGLRRVKYGDHPKLNGSVKYGQLIGSAGFMTRKVPPATGTFTPVS